MVGEQEFEQIVVQQGDYILRLCYTYTNDWQIAEELTQDTFMRFFKAFVRFKGEANIRTYLYRIAVNRCKSYMVTWRYKQMFFGKLNEKMRAHNYVEQAVEKKVEMQVLFEKNWKLANKISRSDCVVSLL